MFFLDEGQHFILAGGNDKKTSQNFALFTRLPDLPEQDYSGWEVCLICLGRIDQAGMVCLICLKSIYQANKGCLTCLSRICYPG